MSGLQRWFERRNRDHVAPWRSDANARTAKTPNARDARVPATAATKAPIAGSQPGARRKAS